MKNKIIIGLICLGLILISLSLISTEKSFDLFSNSSLAQITDIQSEQSSGVKTHGLDQYEETIAKTGMKLRHLDIVKTLQESEVVLELTETKGQIRLLENSEVLIEKSDDQTLLITVRFGDIIVEKFGASPSFWVRKDGRQLTAQDYALSSEKNMEVLRSLGQQQSVATDNNTLSQAKIEEILSSKKSDFFRCYGQLIQKAELAQGQVLISFEISNRGQVIKIDIARSDIEDKSFKSCLVEVVARIKFPKFEGKSVTTVFPLKFD